MVIIGQTSASEREDTTMALRNMTNNNLGLLVAALVSIVAGFVALSADMLSVGPILLVSGYCVLLPFYLWRGFRKSVGE
jgi:hypothetical protein